MLYLSLAGGWRIYAGALSEAMGIRDRIALVMEKPGFTGNGSGEGDDRTGNGSGEGDDRTGNGSGEEKPQTGSERGEGDDRKPVPGTEGSDAPKEAPEFTSVGDDYFADAVFIGDSRTVGLYEYGGLEETSTFYASTGLTVYKLFDSRIVSVPEQKRKITVEEALQRNSFKKIYLMIGINEMGTGTVETFTGKYKEAVEKLLELQPDAILYIQAILKVTEERSSQGDYITNEGIEARNEALAGLADNVRVFYLDANPAICDETGGMAADYTFDGVHLKAQYLELWKDFLKAHAICQ